MPSVGRLVLAAAWLVAGCHSRLPAMVARGEYDAVIDRAESSRFAPRRKAARAYAKALQERGQTVKAMDVLLKDYRRGGQVPSLIALADLEREHGWIGLAAHHYTRVVALDREALKGREDVCRLFRERARNYLDAGEGVAADLDVRKVRFLCPQPSDAGTAAEDRRLQSAADAAADKLVKARVGQSVCREKDCAETRTSDRIAATERELTEATAAGTVALAAASERHGAQVAARDLSRLVFADLAGELGPDPTPDDTIRRWVGDQTWSDLAPEVMSQDAALAGYVQLRLASIVPDLPTGPDPRRGASQLERWADRAVEIPGARPWRLFAWRGDLAAAELELSGSWRPKPTGKPATASPSAPAHWSARAPMTEASFRELLVIARLRRAAGQEDLGLSLTLFNLLRAHAAGLPDALAAAREEALRAVAWGRPWEALAIADAIDSAELAPVRAAAASSIAMARALCDGPCRDDEDAATVERVLGEKWVDAKVSELHPLALGNRSRPASSQGCPTLAEVLAPDAVGPLAEAMATVRTPPAREAVGRGEALAGAIASDLSAWCAGRFALPVMAQAGYKVSAGRLADVLAHAPEMKAARDLVVHAELALVADQHDRAELLAIRAAGLSDTPRAVWDQLGRFAHATGDRDIELMAWRETILHTPSLDDVGARRTMLLHALRDFSRAWASSQAVGREAGARHVQAYLEGFAPASRWAQREALAEAIVDDGLLEAKLAARMPDDTDARGEVITAVFGDPTHARVHARAIARLTGEDPGAAWSALHAAGLAEDARRGRLRRIPPATEAIAPPAEFEAMRLALAESSRDYQLRWRLAIGLATFGSPRARARATVVLRAMAADAGEGALRALDDLLVQRPAAVEPGLAGATQTVAVVDDPDLLLRVLLDLDLRPALLGEP